MEDSKASSDGRGRQSRLQGNVNALFEFASRALGRADSRQLPDRLLDDEEFLERLAGKVVEKLEARSKESAGAFAVAVQAGRDVMERYQRMQALAVPSAEGGDSPIAGVRWAEAQLKAADRPGLECCPRCGHSRQDQ